MANSSETFKTGEMCPREAAYRCLLCRDRGQSTVIALTAGDIFPYCKVCDAKDVTWRRARS
ncbi:MAG: hypothetical protein HY509_03790 [Acidobacteria bacterium]|nr:hypothetical protein [Acidobacteriota bacterium]